MNALAQILSSNTRAELFRLLFGLNSQELHLREIERRSGLAIGSVRQEAEKLLRMELLQRRRNGNRVYFSANTRHPLYVEIHKIVLKTSGLADILMSALKDEDIESAFIFGSIATGKYTADSDIDLFIVGNSSLRNLSKKLRESGDQLGRVINVNVMTKKEFLHRIHNKDHFVTSIITSPKLMIIGAQNDITKLGKE